MYVVCVPAARPRVSSLTQKNYDATDRLEDAHWRHRGHIIDHWLRCCWWNRRGIEWAQFLCTGRRCCEPAGRHRGIASFVPQTPYYQEHFVLQRLLDNADVPHEVVVCRVPQVCHLTTQLQAVLALLLTIP